MKKVFVIFALCFSLQGCFEFDAEVQAQINQEIDKLKEQADEIKVLRDQLAEAYAGFKSGEITAAPDKLTPSGITEMTG